MSEFVRFSVHGSQIRAMHFFYVGDFMSNENKKYCCCFTGHRPEKLNISTEKIKEKLREAIKDSINQGYRTFISGMALGVDIWAAEIVLDEREKEKNIRLICALPYDGFEKKWELSEKKIYQDIIKNADEVVYVCNHYSRYCFQIRNAYMVDHSAKIIAVYNGEKGGTENTIKYAMGKNLEIVNIISEIKSF